MPEAVGVALVAFVELEPDGAVVGGAAGVEVEDEGVVDELDVGWEVAMCSGEEHAAQTSANNPTARPTEVGPFATMIEDRRPLLKLQLGIVGEMSMMSRLAGAINNQGEQSTPLTANCIVLCGAPAAHGTLSSSVHDATLPRDGEYQPIRQMLSGQGHRATSTQGSFPEDAESPGPKGDRGSRLHFSDTWAPSPGGSDQNTGKAK